MKTKISILITGSLLQMITGVLVAVLVSQAELHNNCSQRLHKDDKTNRIMRCVHTLVRG